MGRFLSAVALAFATVQSARFKRKGNAQAKYIAGIPVLNHNVQEAALVEAERKWIAMLDKTATDSFIGKLCDRLGKGCVKGHSKGVPFISISATESFLGKVLQLVGNTGIRYLEPSSTVYAIPEISAQTQTESWGLSRVGTETRRATGKGSNVYVLDTGVRVSHTDFEGRAKPGAESLGDEVIVCGSDKTCAADAQGHGTHCAGTVGGLSYGVAPQASIYSVKVLGDDGSGSLEGIMFGMDWVSTDGVRPAIASMSLGSNSKVESFGDAVDAVFEAGVVVVVAAGNSNKDACGFSPAWVPNAITVGSTDSLDQRSYFSCYGSCVDIWAPGSDITSAAHTSDGGSATFSGTSMACPHVAGAVAALFEEVAGMTSKTAMQELKKFSQSNYISDLSDADVNVFLWVGDMSATEAPPAETPPTFKPAPVTDPAYCSTCYSYGCMFSICSECSGCR